MKISAELATTKKEDNKEERSDRISCDTVSRFSLIKLMRSLMNETSMFHISKDDSFFSILNASRVKIWKLKFVQIFVAWGQSLRKFASRVHLCNESTPLRHYQFNFNLAKKCISRPSSANAEPLQRRKKKDCLTLRSPECLVGSLFTEFLPFLVRSMPFLYSLSLPMSKVKPI